MRVLSSALLVLAAVSTPSNAAFVARPRVAKHAAAAAPRSMSTRADTEPIDWSKFGKVETAAAAAPDYPQASDFEAFAPEDVLPPPPPAVEEAPIDWSQFRAPPVEAAAAPPPPVAWAPPPAAFAEEVQVEVEEMVLPPQSFHDPTFDATLAPSSHSDGRWKFEPMNLPVANRGEEKRRIATFGLGTGETMSKATRDSGEFGSEVQEESNELYENIFTYALAVPFMAFLVAILHGVGVLG